MNFARDYSLTGLNGDTMKASRIQRNISGLHLDLPEALTKPALGGGLNENSRINHLLMGIPTRDYLAEAAALINNGEDPDAVLALHAGQLMRAAAAQRVAAERVAAHTKLFDEHADLIIEEMRVKVFNPLLKRVTKAVESYGLALNLQDAIDAKDFKKAEALSNLDDGFGIMSTLHAVRQALHNESFVGSAAWALEPDALQEGDDPANAYRKRPDCTTPDWWANLIHAGMTPHFPTLGEYLELHRGKEHTEYRQKLHDESAVFASSVTRISQTPTRE